MTITGTILGDPEYHVAGGGDYVSFNIRGCYDDKKYTVKFKSKSNDRRVLKSLMDDSCFCDGAEVVVRGNLNIQVYYQNGRRKTKNVFYANQIGI